MKIGFDAKRAAQNRTGLGNYSRYVLRILSEHMPEEELHLFIPNPRKTDFLSEIPKTDVMKTHYPEGGLWKRLRSLWRVWGITKDIGRQNIDIFHGLSNELPLNIGRSGCRSVVTIHDLIFLHTPEYYKPIDRWIYNYKFRRACINADRVIAVSEYTRQDIIRHYGISPDKIDVVYQGCDPAFAAPISEDKLAEVKARYSLPDRFILYVGSIEKRKNLMLVAKAMTESGNDTQVIAVGKHTPYTNEIRRYLHDNGRDDNIRFVHGVPFSDLPAFYRLASLFVYPSRIEGFGIPMLEAISSGVPAIGCTGSCLEEAGGPDCIYVDPDDVKGMADAIGRVMNDEALRKKMIDNGRKYSRRFNDEALCQEVMNVYEHAAKSVRPQPCARHAR